MSTVIELTEAPDPARCCEQLAGLPYRLFLDSATPGTRLGRYSFLTADPVAVVRSKGAGRNGRTRPERVRQTVWRRARAKSGDCCSPHRRDALDGLPPFQGGAAATSPTTGGGCSSGCRSAATTTSACRTRCSASTTGSSPGITASSRAWLISTGMPETDETARSRRAEERARRGPRSASTIEAPA